MEFKPSIQTALLIGLLAASLVCNYIFFTHAQSAYGYILRWRHRPYNFVYDVSVMIEFCEYEWENYKTLEEFIEARRYDAVSK